jgi:ureidoacrylate peracid hydrolase
MANDALEDPVAVDPFSSKQATRSMERIPPGRTAVVVVDLVNDFVEPAGAMPIADAGPVLEAAGRLVAAGRAAGTPIIWVRPGHLEAVDGLFRKRAVHGMGETWGAQLHPSLPTRDDDRIVRKRRYSAFFATDLDLYLREHNISRVVLAGVALNICVRSTVHDAFFLGYDVWVVRDACQATGPREEASTLYDISTHFGTVLTIDDVLAAWSDRRVRA